MLRGSPIEPLSPLIFPRHCIKVFFDMSLMLDQIGRLRNDADILIDSLRHHWRQIAGPDKTPAERKDIRAQIQHCLDEMGRLLREADALDAEQQDRFIDAELRAR